MSSPTKLQILGAQIRAANEAFKKAKRKPYKGGYEIPPRKERDKHLSRLFGLPPHEISYFLTYSWLRPRVVRGSLPPMPGAESYASHRTAFEG